MLLDVINLAFDYSDKPLLSQVHFSLKAGTLLHLRGGNGVGKTTLLKLLSGLMYPMEGEIRYGGKNIHQNLNEYLQSICVVGHKNGIHKLLTVKEFCQLESKLSASNSSPYELALAFNLQKFLEVRCGLLSVGLQRRVSLLRLLISDARLWLLDEPLVALDTDSVCLLIEQMQHHLSKGGGIVLTSHQPLPMTLNTYQEYFL